MDKTQKAKLKELVEGGKWNYVFIHGILTYGVFGSLIFIFIQKFIFGQDYDLIDINITIIIFGIGSLILGLWGWSNINKKLKEK